MSTMEQGTQRDAQLLEFIPDQIMFEILTRLPVRSLLRFKCVCKSWNSLIRSPNFINTHLDTSSDYIHVNTWLIGSTKSLLSLYCAKTFTKHMDLDLRSCEMNFVSNGFFVYFTCNGLLLICRFCATSGLYIWNPSIRKIQRLPQGLYKDFITCPAIVCVGFGFHHQKNDYKVVRVIRLQKGMYKTEVYSLKLNSWRDVAAVLPIPIDSRYLTTGALHVNGVVYWKVRVKDSARYCILSFDMDNEVFSSRELPEKVMGQDTWNMMPTIFLPLNAWPLSFTKDGACIARLDENRTLVLYDPISQEAKEITRVEGREYCNVSRIIHTQKRSKADVRTRLKVQTSALGLKCGRLSVRHRTAPTTAHHHPSGLQQRPRVRRISVFLSDHPKLQTKSIWPENWNSTKMPGIESGQGRCWSSLGWRRALAGAVRWRTEGRPHFKSRTNASSVYIYIYIYIYIYLRKGYGAHVRSVHEAPFTTLRCRRRRASTPADSNSVPDHFLSPTRQPNSSFRFYLKFWVISPRNWNSAYSPGRASDRGHC
ncbi:hypothetical protein ACLB2K_072493 [Fragaria x ananassa]